MHEGIKSVLILDVGKRMVGSTCQIGLPKVALTKNPNHWNLNL